MNGSGCIVRSWQARQRAHPAAAAQVPDAIVAMQVLPVHVPLQASAMMTGTQRNARKIGIFDHGPGWMRHRLQPCTSGTADRCQAPRASTKGELLCLPPACGMPLAMPNV